jgi:hypothetical protein
LGTTIGWFKETKNFLMPMDKHIHYAPNILSKKNAMSDEKTNLVFALTQVENISKLIKGNEYEHYLSTHILPIKHELERQLTNLQNYPTK